MKRILVALLESMLTALYWWMVATFSFGLFGEAAIRRPRRPIKGKSCFRRG